MYSTSLYNDSIKMQHEEMLFEYDISQDQSQVEYETRHWLYSKGLAA